MASDDFDPYQQWLGIPPTVRPIDYYTLLGIEPFCDDRQRIERAAEQRMRLLRTFQTGPRGVYTQKLLNEITQARLRLLDARKKAEYDERLRRSQQAAAELAVADESLSVPPGALSTRWPLGHGPAAGPAIVPPATITTPPHGTPVPTASGSAPGASPSGWQAPASSPAGGIGPAAAPGGGVAVGPRAVGPSAPLPRKRSRRARRVPWWKYFWLASICVLTVAVPGGLWVLWHSGFFQRRPPTQSAVTRTAQSHHDHAGPTAAIVPDLNGELHFRPDTVTMVAGEPVRRPSDDQPLLSQWQPVTERLEWSFLISKSALYEAQLTYHVEGDPSGARWVISLDGGPPKTWDLTSSGGDGQPQVLTTMIFVRGAGLHKLSLGLQNLPAAAQVAFHSVVLRPKR